MCTSTSVLSTYYKKATGSPLARLAYATEAVKRDRQANQEAQKEAQAKADARNADLQAKANVPNLASDMVGTSSDSNSSATTGSSISDVSPTRRKKGLSGLYISYNPSTGGFNL